jgi:hypothetical protein
MFKENGNENAKDRSLMLKIDVESAEWKVFAEEPVENLKKFREIVVEYHWIHEVNKHPLYLKAVKKIEQAGFSVSAHPARSMSASARRMMAATSCVQMVWTTDLLEPTLTVSMASMDGAWLLLLASKSH